MVSERMRRELDEYLAHPAPQLSEQEIRILELVQEGLANTHIARELGLSRHTIKNALNGINQKLGTRNRIDAYEKAEEMGLIGWRW